MFKVLYRLREQRSTLFKHKDSEYVYSFKMRLNINIGQAEYHNNLSSRQNDEFTKASQKIYNAEIIVGK